MSKLISEICTDLRNFCTDIGCSGVDKQCPGNPHCAIVQKVFQIPIEASVIIYDHLYSKEEAE